MRLPIHLQSIEQESPSGTSLKQTFQGELCGIEISLQHDGRSAQHAAA
jgi:hypothetical protein